MSVYRFILSLGVIMLMAALPAAAQTLTKEPGGTYVTDRQTATAPLRSGQKVSITAAGSLSGSVTLSAGGSACAVEYRKHLKADDKSEAGDYANLITVTIDKTPEGVIVSLSAPAAAPWSGTDNSARLELVVTIPDNCPVNFATAYFSIDATGPFAGMTIAETISKVRVSNVKGATDIRVAQSPLAVSDLKGEIYLSNKFAPIKADNIATGAEQGTITNESGDVFIESYSGSLDLRTSNKRISAKGLYLTTVRNQIKNNAGPIELDFDSLTAGSVRVNNQYGQIALAINGRADARFICKAAGSGSVTADKLVMTPTLVDDNRLEFTTGGGNAEVRLTTREDGAITITGSDTQKGSGDN
jgi:hypothetical protein